MQRIRIPAANLLTAYPSISPTFSFTTAKHRISATPLTTLVSSSESGLIYLFNRIGGFCDMGYTVREKHIRTNRRKPDSDHSANGDLDKSKTGMKSNVFDDNCTEEQLEEILLKNLEFLYNEAINKLIALGYDEEVGLKAILRNGHTYGGMDG